MKLDILDYATHKPTGRVCRVAGRCYRDRNGCRRTVVRFMDGDRRMVHVAVSDLSRPRRKAEVIQQGERR